MSFKKNGDTTVIHSMGGFRCCTETPEEIYRTWCNNPEDYHLNYPYD
jgi:hypothetical protein